MYTTHRLLPAAIALVASAAVWGDSPRSFEREVAAPARGVVEISSTNGTVDVTGWDRAAVSVKAELAADVERVEVTNSGDHTVVRVIQQHSGMSFSGHDETHLRVQVPKDSEVDVSTVSANMTSAGVLGAQRLKSVSGDITAEIGPSDIEAKSVSGSLKLRGKGQPSKLHVSTVSGDLELKHAAGDLEATTVSGEATVELDPARSVRVRSTSGDIHFEGRLARGADFDGQTVSGDLKVRAAAEDGLTFEAATVTGDINDCFNVEAENSKYGPGHKLNGSRGGGSAHVRLKSMSGEIDLCDRK
ncbi:MAG TPA: DUF4097 family beta strand repeat-containing protein [Steroidobacteraceae bacterium]|jgi:DUF4097 and DUF4098 domain-containing protein YvlB